MFGNISFNTANEPRRELQHRMTQGLWKVVNSTRCDTRTRKDPLLQLALRGVRGAPPKDTLLINTKKRLSPSTHLGDCYWKHDGARVFETSGNRVTQNFWSWNCKIIRPAELLFTEHSKKQGGHREKKAFPPYSLCYFTFLSLCFHFNMVIREVKGVHQPDYYRNSSSD